MTNIQEAPSLEESSSIKEDEKSKDNVNMSEGDDDRKTFIGHLYSIESRVEKLRERALEIEQEKCLLLQELQQVQDNDKHIEFSEDERDEIEALAERMICRCLTIEISVTTPRNESQENALKCVNKLLQQLEALCECSVEIAIGKTKAYLNACLAEPTGCVDQRFQGSILGCTIDDQKKIKSRLQRLLADLGKSCEVVSL